MRQKYIYMKVTRDRFELPLAIADTPTELAKICRTRATYINTCICQRKKNGLIRPNGKPTKSEYVRIPVTEEFFEEFMNYDE